VPAEETGAAIGRAAGRIVRAAGLAGLAAARELEKRADAPAEAAAAPAEPASQETPPERQETRAPSARTAKRRRAEPRPNKLLDTAVYYLWLASLLAFASTVIVADLLVPEGTPRIVTQLVLAAVFLVMGWLLLTDWWQVRQRLLIRLVRGKDGSQNRGGWLARLGRELLTLVGITWIALGLWDLARAFTNGNL
jgi:hypothetical protein